MFIENKRDENEKLGNNLKSKLIRPHYFKWQIFISSQDFVFYSQFNIQKKISPESTYLWKQFVADELKIVPMIMGWMCCDGC